MKQGKERGRLASRSSILYQNWAGEYGAAFWEARSGRAQQREGCSHVKPSVEPSTPHWMQFSAEAVVDSDCRKKPAWHTSQRPLPGTELVGASHGSHSKRSVFQNEPSRLHGSHARRSGFQNVPSLQSQTGAPLDSVEISSRFLSLSQTQSSGLEEPASNVVECVHGVP